jgi:predicted dehydrogenase
MNKQLNVLIFGSGHYVSGQTLLSDMQPTDKDLGVILPSLFYLRFKNLVDKISIYSRSKDKISSVTSKYSESKILSKYDISFDHIEAESSCIRSSENLQNAIQETQFSAAIIALPDHMHKEALEFCIKNKIPSMVLKPAVTNLDDFYFLKELMPKDYLCMVDYHKVYDDANMIIESKLRNNEVGKILAVSSYMSQRIAMVEVYKDVISKEKLNINHYLGSHYIHLIGFFTMAHPIFVRATGQYGKIKEKFDIDVFDTMQTSITWKSKDGSKFESYHHAGWNDSIKSPSMTYQDLRINTSEGVIFSNQRNRGLEFVAGDIGLSVLNPYFFSPIDSFAGDMNVSGSYGFTAIKKFLTYSQQPASEMPIKKTSFAESEIVTAVLEAADLSIASNSEIVEIGYNGKYHTKVAN